MIPFSLAFVLASLGLLVWGLVATSQVLVWGSLGASIAAGVCLSVSVLQRRGRASAADAPPVGDPPPLPVDLGRPGTGPPVAPPFASSGAGPAVSPTSTGLPPAEPPAVQPPAVQPPAVQPPAVQPPATGPGPGTTGRPGVPPTQPATGTQPHADGATQSPGERPRTPPADAAAGIPPPADGVAADTRTPTGQPPQDRTAATPVTGAGRGPETTGGGPDAEPAEEDIPVAAALRAAQLDDEVLVVDGRPRYHLAGCAFLAGKPTVPLPLSTARRTGFTPCGLCCPDSTLLARARR